jgi:hypothetical protein
VVAQTVDIVKFGMAALCGCGGYGVRHFGWGCSVGCGQGADFEASNGGASIMVFDEQAENGLGVDRDCLRWPVMIR